MLFWYLWCCSPRIRSCEKLSNLAAICVWGQILCCQQVGPAAADKNQLAPFTSWCGWSCSGVVAKDAASAQAWLVWSLGAEVRGGGPPGCTFALLRVFGLRPMQCQGTSCACTQSTKACKVIWLACGSSVCGAAHLRPMCPWRTRRSQFKKVSSCICIWTFFVRRLILRWAAYLSLGSSIDWSFAWSFEGSCSK